MIDIVQAAVRSIASRSSGAPALAFAAGTLSCVGPCVAPRIVAVAACAGSSGRPALTLAAFMAGLSGAYAALGALAGTLGSALDLGSWSYVVLAVALGAGGSVALVRADENVPCTVVHSRCGPSLRGVFLFGVASALVPAACCAPIASVTAAYAAQAGDPVYGAAMLSAFALGHGLPVAAVGLGTGALSSRLRRLALHQAVAIASASLCIVFSAFYSCLV